MLRIVLFFIVFFNIMFCADESTSKFLKQKIEIRELKKDLNSFYTKKEEEYKQRKQELDAILAKIEKEKADIEKIKNQNLEILQDIKGEVQTKTAKIYNNMKPKVTAEIFNKMIDEGNIDDVFDIILKLKEKKVTLIMKFLSVKNASMLTLMLKDYNNQNKKG
ncbi:MotE family protein [Malaciobacter mytili]|uniref:Motility protein chaperone MotE n=1 Tax=Malaciobacter mytili LMG 24559 TaxID=1032238 RepID=A0AAX2AIN5_9BACT|nr:hypothetical protein [Malaciobacter mytili]AXH16021.1 hypothetical protein AMYT_2486 [Malaciobacter mytili LMG 24559]RXI48874.1 hypothetical protein CRU99_00450 [Malaciobacter mytili]RXK15793.1 hypothetical protein CP985_06800 [Malaciobacter mytili LMG 24559]